MTIHFLHDPKRAKAADLFNTLVRMHGQRALEDADTVVAIGGDGSVLYALARAAGKTVFPLLPHDARSVGFWVNRVEDPTDLLQAIAEAEPVRVNPIRASVHYEDAGRAPDVLHAFNEVSVVRDDAQAAFIDITGLEGPRGTPIRLTGDGVCVATPLGATGSNLSYGGPLVPLDMPVWMVTGMGTYSPKKAPAVVVRDSLRLVVTPVTSAGKRPVRIEYDGNTLRPSAPLSHITLESGAQAGAWLALLPRTRHVVSRVFA